MLKQHSEDLAMTASTKSVAQKLLIKPGTALWLSHPEQRRLVEPLPEGVQEVAGPGKAATALIFVADAASARAALDAHRGELARPSALWVLYPKGNKADINRDTLWPILAEYGLRPISQVAVDETWSALRFRPLKEGEAQFTGGR
jgi:hypothetical protein